MGGVSRITRARRNGSGSRSLRAITIPLAVLAMATAGLAIAPAADARGTQADTVAVVSGQGRFSLLSDTSSKARVSAFYFGNPSDEPLMGDWNCDGEQTPGMYRRSAGSVYLRQTNTQGIADVSFYFGIPGDIPLVGDFDGDGCDTLGVYRPSEARFYISDRLGNVVADRVFYFGDLGDSPVVGDWNGDGVDSIGVFRSSIGLVALRNRNSAGIPDRQFYFGNPKDTVLSGDWDGDGVDTVAVYRSSKGVVYFKNTNRSGVADSTMKVGKGQRVVSVSGVDPNSISDELFVPDEPQAAAPAPPSPAPTYEVPVPGFDAPPARQESGPIDISGQSNVVIENLHISNPGGTCVTVTNGSNVTIRNSTIGPCGDDAVYLSDVANASVSGNYITDTNNGVLIHRSDSVRVDSNTFINAGRNFVQFDKVNGSGSSISGNRGQNELGGSNAEDLISVYWSNGTSSSPIRVVGNHLRNGGPSGSGSGIMLGDGNGTHQVVEDNVLVNPGQVGIGVASGNDIVVRNNKIYSEALSWSNVGLYVWDQYGGCGSVEIAGNQVNWTAAGGYSNGFFNGGGCDASVHDNDWNANIGPGIF
jgi:parallel beta-helix repeat protein